MESQIPTSDTMRLTIVGPQFFSYVDGIVSHIDSLGIPVQAIDERGSQSFFIKSIFRSYYLKKLFSLVIKKKHKDIIKKSIEFESTHVLFISPESVNSNLIESMKNEGLKVILYMWDSFDNKPSARTCIDVFDKAATFDPVDAQIHKLNVINLFAEDYFFNVNRNDCFSRKIDISFVGTVHSSRPKIIKKLVTNPRFSSFNKKMYLYRGNYYYYLRALLITGFSRCTPLSKSSISKSAVAEIFNNSKYVLDITHSSQRGLTSRTFEALASGSVLVTNNLWSRELLPKFSGQIILFEDIELLELSHKGINISEQPHTDMYSLTLSRFCNDILELAQ